MAGDLEWRAEEACLNAWPSPKQILVDGWVIRISGGTTRRVNSVNPLRHVLSGISVEDINAVSNLARPLYGRYGSRLLFRVPSFARELDSLLARLGYSTEGETCTLLADLESQAWTDVLDDPVVDLADVANSDWLTAKALVTSASEEQNAAFRETTASIALPVAFASLKVDAHIVSVAYGAIHNHMLVLESVATDPRFFRRGYGRKTVAALMAWGQRHGASAACLQVAADNHPALGLYRGLGFDRELYRYHYRSEPT